MTCGMAHEYQHGFRQWKRARKSTWVVTSAIDLNTVPPCIRTTDPFLALSSIMYNWLRHVLRWLHRPLTSTCPLQGNKIQGYDQSFSKRNRLHLSIWKSSVHQQGSQISAWPQVASQIVAVLQEGPSQASVTVQSQSNYTAGKRQEYQICFCVSCRLHNTIPLILLGDHMFLY